MATDRKQKAVNPLAPGKAHVLRPGEGGRKPGAINKTTKLLREVILTGAEKAGSDGEGKDGLVGYLKWLSRAEPASYAMLLGKILPLQLHMTGNNPNDLPNSPPRMTADEIRQELERRGLRMPTMIDVTPEKATLSPPEEEEQEASEVDDEQDA